MSTIMLAFIVVKWLIVVVSSKLRGREDQQLQR